MMQPTQKTYHIYYDDYRSGDRQQRSLPVQAVNKLDAIGKLPPGIFDNQAVDVYYVARPREEREAIRDEKLKRGKQ